MVTQPRNIDSIFDAIVSLNDAERDGYLDEHCTLLALSTVGPIGEGQSTEATEAIQIWDIVADQKIATITANELPCLCQTGASVDFRPRSSMSATPKCIQGNIGCSVTARPVLPRFGMELRLTWSKRIRHRDVSYGMAFVGHPFLFHLVRSTDNYVGRFGRVR